MWLLKKFWNTDIIGKIYILIILFIVIVATITVITRYKNASTNQIENEQKNEIIGEDIKFELNVIDNNVTAVANIKENEHAQEEITEQSKKNIKNQNVETKKQEKSTIKTSSTLSSNKTIQDKKTENQFKKDNENTKVEQDIKKEAIKESKKSLPIEEYKVNNNMINKMKEAINNNKTEDMINYGYEILVDSSIVNKTNYFTYSDKRLISKLVYRFGTIRIYSRDLYVNGEYAHTECYIY